MEKNETDNIHRKLNKKRVFLVLLPILTISAVMAFMATNYQDSEKFLQEDQRPYKEERKTAGEVLVPDIKANIEILHDFLSSHS